MHIGSPLCPGPQHSGNSPFWARATTVSETCRRKKAPGTDSHNPAEVLWPRWGVCSWGRGQGVTGSMARKQRGGAMSRGAPIILPAGRRH